VKGRLVSDVFEEVEEELRRDKYAEFFQKHAVSLIAVVVLVLAAVGGYQAWQAWEKSNAGGYAAQMEDAAALVQQRKVPEAEAKFTEISKSAPAGYKTAALLALGGLRTQSGDLKGALGFYDQAAAASPTKEYRDVARLKAAYIAADVEPAKLEARLKPLIDEAGVFALQARELRGMQAYGAGDFARAREDFEFLSIALDAPQSLRTRAQSALAVIGPAPKGAAPADASKPSSNPGEKK
jgi:hypothetical protein